MTLKLMTLNLYNWCIEVEISIFVLSRILGHKYIQTTLNTYTSVFNKFKEDELNKINIYIDSI